jgi:hypothetical protein
MSQENLISFLRNNFLYTNIDENNIFTSEEILQALYDERQPDYSVEGDNANLNNNTEDYIDFRDYPLKIDWAEIENYEENYYNIFINYGYFGMAILTSLIKVENLTINYDDFFYSILSFYNDCIKKKKIDDLNNFYNHLPKLEKIKEIVFAKKIHKKEFIPLKIILDIYENYLLQDNFNFINNKDIIIQFLKISEFFYKRITSDVDILDMYNKLKDMEKTSKIIMEMKCIIVRKRKIYLYRLKLIYNDYINISKDLNKNLFIK